MSCGIYKITNLLNQKSYIGQSINIEVRFNKHKTAKDDFYIHRALRKYGIENFSFEIIELCDLLQLDEKEKFWINYYNSLVPNGYNMIPGGSNGAGLSKGKPVLQYDLQGNFIAKYPSVRQAALDLDLNTSNINSCCHGKRNYVGDWQWRFEDSNLPLQKIEVIEKIIIKKIIVQYDLNDNFIAEYPSALEAKRQTGIHNGNIGECCRGKRKSAGGYKWKEKEIQIIKKEKKIK